MGTLRNTSITNTFGGGYVQIYTDDDGNEYTIRNTSMHNVFGDGYEKIAEDKHGNRFRITNGSLTNVFGDGHEIKVTRESPSPYSGSGSNEYTIRNTSLQNVFGDGYEKIAEDEYGNRFRITNSSLSNVFGDGNEIKIDREDSPSQSYSPIADNSENEYTSYGSGMLGVGGSTEYTAVNSEDPSPRKSYHVGMTQDEMDEIKKSTVKSMRSALKSALLICAAYVIAFLGLIKLITSPVIGVLMLLSAALIFIFSTKYHRIYAIAAMMMAIVLGTVIAIFFLSKLLV